MESYKSASFRNKPREIDGNPVHNRILLSLSPEVYDRVADDLELVRLKLNDVLQEPQRPVKFCYFINSGMVSFLSLTKVGKSVEVGLSGKEGFVGTALSAGFTTSGNRAVVQGDGTAFRMGRRDFLDALDHHPELSHAMARSLQESTFQVSQIAACNQRHNIEPRLARWLLMSHDRMGTPQLPLTHEFLAHMLVVNRSTVSTTAAKLQKAGLIDYRQGKISIRDRRKLEKATCDCYELMTDQLAMWDRELESRARRSTE